MADGDAKRFWCSRTQPPLPLFCLKWCRRRIE
jgi:hypothetical protein